MCGGGGGGGGGGNAVFARKMLGHTKEKLYFKIITFL
jgi:hypothetical protein